MECGAYDFDDDGERWLFPEITGQWIGEPELFAKSPKNTSFPLNPTKNVRFPRNLLSCRGVYHRTIATETTEFIIPKMTARYKILALHGYTQVSLILSRVPPLLHYFFDFASPPSSRSYPNSTLPSLLCITS